MLRFPRVAMVWMSAKSLCRYDTQSALCFERCGYTASHVLPHCSKAVNAMETRLV